MAPQQHHLLQKRSQHSKCIVEIRIVLNFLCMDMQRLSLPNLVPLISLTLFSLNSQVTCSYTLSCVRRCHRKRMFYVDAGLCTLTQGVYSTCSYISTCRRNTLPSSGLKIETKYCERRYNPEDEHRHLHRHKNLKFRLFSLLQLT